MIVPDVSHIWLHVGMARGSMRLKREPDYWELRAYARREPITGRPKYVSRTFRGGKRDAGKALTQLVAEIDVKGTQADLSVDGLLRSHIDHLEQRGRGARTIEGYRSIARRVAADRLGRRQLNDVGPQGSRRLLRSSSVERLVGRDGSAIPRTSRWRLPTGDEVGWASRNVVRLATPPAVPRQS